MKARLLVAAFAALLVLAFGQPTSAQAPAPNTVDCTSKVPMKPVAASPKLSEDGKLVVDNPPAPLELKGTLYVHVTGLPEFLDEVECRKKNNQPPRKLVLFLDGLSLKGLAYALPRPPKDGILKFSLLRTDENKAAWTQILSNPCLTPRDLPVSVGYEDQYPFESGISIKFRTLPLLYFWLGALFLAALLWAFYYLVRHTGICRDGAPESTPGVSDAQKIPAGALGPFSLSRLQGAVWFFVIFGSYVAIAAVTFDINGTINATALALLGIGAATVVGAAVVDNNSNQSAPQPNQKTPAQVITDLDQQIEELKKRLDANPNAADAPAVRKSLADTMLAYKRATNQSTGILWDILSDANGVNLHRFQMVAWTIVLAFVFARTVAVKLAMPDFDNTLLGLLGLSAGTYIGLKVNEPTTPNIPPAPKKPGS